MCFLAGFLQTDQGSVRSDGRLAEVDQLLHQKDGGRVENGISITLFDAINVYAFLD